jgi:eukaryotic-like serine/threonine-protein kinase
LRQDHSEFRDTEGYQIKKQLGAGGMGIVYLAQDLRQGIPVALKTLKKMSPQSLYHFKNEFRALADLRHPNLIELYELINDSGLWFFTMEYLPDAQDFMTHVRGAAGLRAATVVDDNSTTDLARLAQTLAEPSSHNALTLAEGVMPDTQDGPVRAVRGVAPNTRPISIRFDEAKVRDSFRQLAQGIAALHAIDKVHRDIKPSNVMVVPGAKPRVVLMDFGLVTRSGEGNQRGTLSNMVGTPLYMPPEQASSLEVGPPADWYSFGVMLYEVFAGRAPFIGTLIEVVLAKTEEDAPPLSMFAPHAPEDLATLCMDLLRRDPSARPSQPEIFARLGIEQTDTSRVFSAPFVGRRDELKKLKSAFVESRTGHAAAIFVQGPSGLGKSALIKHFLEQLEQKHAALILSGRCYEQETVPYKAFDEIIDSLSRVLLGMERELPGFLPEEAVLVGKLFPVLHRIPLLAKAAEPRVSSLQELRARAFVALREIFRRLGSERPLVLFIDDLQWSDQDSIVLLREILHPHDPASLLVVASVRTSRATSGAFSASQPSAHLEQVPAALAAINAHKLMLLPLPIADAQELARKLSARSGEEANIEGIIREAGGHPLFIDELLRRKNKGAIKLDDALWERVCEHEAPSRRIVELVALAGSPLAQRVIADAAALSMPEFIRRTAELRRAQIVRTLGNSESDSIEPYHDRIRESVTAHLTRETLRGHSAQLSRALENSGAAEHSPELLMRHLEGAGLIIRAAALAEKAAQRASAALAFDRAAEFLRTALRLGKHTVQDLYRLHLALAEALANAGRGPEAAEAYLEASHEQEPNIQLELKHKAAKQFLGSGHVARGLDLLRLVLAEFGESMPNTPSEALDGFYQSRDFLQARGLGFVARTEHKIEPRKLILLDVFSSISFGLSFVDNVRGAYFQTRSLQLALQVGEPNRLARSLMIEAMYVAQEGGEHINTAKVLYKEACRILARNQDPYMAAFLIFGGAFLEYYEGKFRIAAQRFHEAEKRFKEIAGAAWELSTSRLHRLRATDYQGAWEELRPLYNEYIHDAQRRDDRFAEQSLRRWFNVLWLANDQPEKAGEDLDKNPWSAPSGGYHLQHFLEVRARLELAIYRGNAASADWVRAALDDAAGSFLFRIQIARAISDWLRGRLALCQALALGSPEHLIVEAEEMSARLFREDSNYASIWGMLLQAAALTHRNKKQEALALLQDTMRYATAQDFPLCAAVSRRRQGELLGGPAGERLIELADMWMRSQEIANPARMSEIFAPGFLFS